MDKFIGIFRKNWKTWFLVLVGLTEVKGTSVRKQVTKKVAKGETGSISFGAVFDQKSINKNSKNHAKNNHPKTLNLIPKGSQNGAKIDAKTYQKSMPKPVTKNNHGNHQKSYFSVW